MQFLSVYIPLFILLTFTPMVSAESIDDQLIHAANSLLHNKAKQTAIELNADQFQIRTRPLPEHTKTPPCKTPIEMKDFSTAPYGEQLLQAVCKDQWRLLVKARILIYRPVIVSSRNIMAIRPLNEHDIEWQSRDISILQQGYLTKPQQVLGKVPRSEIKAGTPLNPSLFHDGT
ncbi:hypothetical protein ACH42_03645 [Endozoicomonas sp. (ex Bugula neritina AB1)]|nr:hypothetical protein ACH42_03645 [Endozoicomonas sp. (ex Bugula neritina AB1)]